MAAATASRSERAGARTWPARWPAALLSALLALPGVAGTADVRPAVAEDAPGRVAELRARTPAALGELIDRVDRLAREGGGYPELEPVVVVLHGDEAAVFTRELYPRYRELVDRAARLSAYGVVDVRICERWMSNNGVRREELPAFVDTVRYGPAEVDRLKAEGYVTF